MSFTQALVYFVREASVSLIRSWKVSLLAVLTITLSLFLGGVFLWVSGNLEQVIVQWSSESRIVVYLKPGTPENDQQRLREALRQPAWALDVEKVSAEQAQERFHRAFPSLSDLLEGWGEEPLPASLEVSLDLAQAETGAYVAWVDAARADPAVSMIDDDRDWLEQLEAVVLLIRSLGVVLGAILLATAIFTISSVIRLTAYLYRDEIAVMRLVGATEFFIRGPFYMEGLIQGVAGGLLATGALFGSYAVVFDSGRASILASILTAEFLGPSELAVLVATGGLAGLIGAVTSLRKESLGQTGEYPDWTSEKE